MAITVVATRVTQSSITCRIEGLGGTSYRTLQITLNGNTRYVSYSSNYMTTTTTFTGLAGNSQYTASAYAVSTAGSTGSGYGYLRTSPNAPSYVYTNSVTSNGAYIYWGTPSGGASYYKLVIRYGSSSGSIVSTYYPSSTGYTVSGLSAGTTYYAGVLGYNNNGDEGLSNSTTFTTASPTPSWVSIYSTSYSDSISISWSSASYANGYNVEVYYGSSTSGSLAWYSYGVRGNSAYATGLSAGTMYTIKVYGYNGSGNGTPNTRTTYTVPSSVGTIYGSADENTISGAWFYTTGATGYRVVLRRGTTSSGALIQSVNTTSTNYTFTGLDYGTTYYFGVVAYNSAGDAVSSSNTFTTTTPRPTNPTNFSITSKDKSFHCSWRASSYATSYTVEAYHANTGAYVAYANTTGTSVTITGLNEYVAYRLKLFAKNSDGNSSGVYANGTTLDVTPPTVSIASKESKGKMYISWSASDTGSGIRPSNSYLVQITAKGGTTYYGSTYTTNKYYSFTSDGAGNAFVEGGVYYMRVIAYDASGNNSTATSGAMTYRKGRPNDWAWTTSKVAGSKINVTATEWNSLCTRINQFRQYQGYDNYNFTTVKTGMKITASIANEARVAISIMTTKNLPPAVSVGSKITASFFNGLVTAINGIP